MKQLKTIFTAALLLSLVACKITGEAEDEFDREDQEPKIGLGNISILKSKSRKENEELRARLERLESAQRTGNAPVYQPTTNTGDITAPPIGGNAPVAVPAPQTGVNISSQDAANFEEWKRARASSSNDYKEFQEYQEWLEFKKLKEQKQQ